MSLYMKSKKIKPVGYHALRGKAFVKSNKTALRNKASQASLCTKTQLFHFININVFLFHQQVLFKFQFFINR